MRFLSRGPRMRGLSLGLRPDIVPSISCRTITDRRDFVSNQDRWRKELFDLGLRALCTMAAARKSGAEVGDACGTYSAPAPRFMLQRVPAWPNATPSPVASSWLPAMTGRRRAMMRSVARRAGSGSWWRCGRGTRGITFGPLLTLRRLHPSAAPAPRASA